MRKRLAVLAFLISVVSNVHGQDTLKSILGKERIGVFINKLENFDSLDNRKLHIVHIGDSHIQADYFSGRMREYFQEKYGNGGRGLVFPYRLSKTNGATDIKYTSNVYWSGRRNSYGKLKRSTGIAGHCIETNTKDAQILVESELDQFDQVTIFHSQEDDVFVLGLRNDESFQQETKKQIVPDAKYHKVKSGDTLYGIARKYGVSVSKIKTWNGINSSMIRPGQKLVVSSAGVPAQIKKVSSNSLNKYVSKPDSLYAGQKFDLPDTVSSFYIQVNDQAKSSKVDLMGILLENSKADGIVYSAIGANGATFEDYVASQYFFDQISALKPDLLIVSLGTNESFNSPFKAEEIEASMNEFLGQLKEKTSCDQILMTTPPDVKIKKGRYREYNPKAKQIRDMELRVADENEVAIWDFYEAMGGYKSIKNWKDQGLAQRDYVHFTKEGYYKQADMLWSEFLMLTKSDSIVSNSFADMDSVQVEEVKEGSLE
ncbi:LysM peptidoglycan-binding domain-containing protein [Aureibacter tunicatorum]|uniref:LysM repeat protein n=1 Tax=Aureibacter tunicatorum TaxID=866807 RepID=A0AAE3XMK2_9BACT|nr:LysM peptidoglycan-binding domain-containing protein [Aureibacter tunicatorum]MDR6239255.1 LysM repeat protein [Aureibacter tunicatorum]BDD04820.1 hypothetical protein AUTU_23030 [Aureibacter tunicatorum]